MAGLSAGLVQGSRLLDGPVQGIGLDDTVAIAQKYELVVLYTSTAGFASDIRLAERIKASTPEIKIAFVGPHVTAGAEVSLQAASAVDFVVRGEFDYPVAEFAEGRHLEDIAGVTYRWDGRIIHNPPRQPLQNLDALPFFVDVYKRDLDYTRYNIPYLLHPYVSFYTSRGCPALCTFCLWPQTMSGHPWRTRSIPNVVAEVQRCREVLPQAKEIFFEDDTFPWAKARTLDICQAFKALFCAAPPLMVTSADGCTMRPKTFSNCVPNVGPLHAPARLDSRLRQLAGLYGAEAAGES